MIYLIGGPARCGKSTVARQLRKNVDGQIIAGDAVVHALQAVLDPEWWPDIFDQEVAQVSHFSSDVAKIDRLRRRDEMMWQFYAAFCRTSIEDAARDDILIEGSLWPDFLEGFPYSHKAVFLIDTSEGQYERLLNVRDSKDSDNNWMRNYDDARMKQWARFNAVRSQRYAELCRQHGCPYFDIAVSGIQEAEEKALAYLLSSEV